MTLVDSLIKEGWLKTPKIIEAFRKIKRKDFLPEDLKHLSEANIALPTLSGQTISQPLVVAFMLELLQPEEGEKILDVGAGSGWTAALLAYCVSSEEVKLNVHSVKPREAGAAKRQQFNRGGKIIAIEIVPEVKEFGEKNVRKYNFVEKRIVQFVCGDGSKGYGKEAPFDKILASASARFLPEAWKEQLKTGGKIVTPIGASIFSFEKKSEKDFEKTEYPGFTFVPLINK